MGCTSAKQRSPDLMRMNTVTGILRITVTSAQVSHQTSVFKMDPYVKLKLSNQQFETKVVLKGDKHPVFNQTFSFHINSCFKSEGRCLEVHMMDKNKVGGDKKIGYGIVDLDPIVNLKKSKQAFRCFLNYDSKPAGYVNFIAEFIQETAKTISFRFQTATLRRKTSTFGNMHCWVHIIIGEEELKTEKKSDTKQHSPTWFNQIVAFNISESIPECKISLYDDKNLVGTTTLLVKDLLKTNEEQTFNQELIYNGNSAGTLVFQTKVGTNPVFSIIKAVHSKILQNQGDQKKQSTLNQQQKRQSFVRQSKVQKPQTNPEDQRESEPIKNENHSLQPSHQEPKLIPE